jgi:diaminopimelate decarboxylase
MNDPPNRGVKLDEPARTALCEVVRRHGTPTYAFDVPRCLAQVARLRDQLPAEVDVLYSLKANASLGICDIFAKSGVGADVASAGELATAREAGFAPERIFVAGPWKSAETVAHLRELPEATISIDSPSELRYLATAELNNAAVLRLRPDFGSCAVVPAGAESRFGFSCDDLDRCRDHIGSGPPNVIGFHVFAGSQVLDAEKLNEHLRRSLDLALRAAERIGIAPRLLNLGGGFGIPYGPDAQPLDLRRVADELGRLADRAAPARLILELGRYLVAEAGWYLTTVIGHHSVEGRQAVIVDGGVHQRADMCGLRLRSHAYPPVVLDSTEGPLAVTDVWGCLSLPDDVIIERSPLPPLRRGDILAFANAGAYGLWSSPAQFHGHPLPCEVAFDGSTIQLMRTRKPPHAILDGQQHVRLMCPRTGQVSMSIDIS